MNPSEVRQTLGLSIEEMALAMGVHRQTWVKWERGERRPDNASAQLMRLLCWLHEKRGQVLVQWLREI